MLYLCLVVCGHIACISLAMKKWYDHWMCWMSMGIRKNGLMRRTSALVEVLFCRHESFQALVCRTSTYTAASEAATTEHESMHYVPGFDAHGYEYEGSILLSDGASSTHAYQLKQDALSVPGGIYDGRTIAEKRSFFSVFLPVVSRQRRTRALCSVAPGRHPGWLRIKE